MKKYPPILFVALLFSLSVGAKPSAKAELEVVFQKDKKVHRYLVLPDAKKKDSFVISFVNEKKKVQRKRLSSKQFESMKSFATRIFWENQFRGPASFETCKEYMTLLVDGERTRVCRQNARMTGRSFGFLNSLHRIFQE